MNRRRRSPAGPPASEGPSPLEQTFEQSAEPGVGAPPAGDGPGTGVVGTGDAAGTGGMPVPGSAAPTANAAIGLTHSSVLEMTVDGKESIMSPTGAPDESSASLTGLLAVFSLSDVLMFLASATQTGELHAVGDDVEGWLWLTEGQLANARVGSATTIGQAVFELACITQGEFSFTSGVVSSSGNPTVPVAAVLQEVRPQVDEWRELKTVLPLDAEVNLSPNPPGQDVRIRSDQWQVLTTVGNSGLSVKSVLERIGGEQVAGLRTLRDLQAAGLIVVGSAADSRTTGVAPGAFSAGVGADPVSPHATVHPVGAGTGNDAGVGEAGAESEQDRSAGLAEVAMMPPPIAVDPWAPVPETEETGDNGVA